MYPMTSSVPPLALVTLLRANVCRLCHFKYRAMIKAMSGKKNPKHFNFLDKCKHPKQRIIVTTLVSFSQSNYCKGIWINVNEQSQEKRGTLMNKNFLKKDIQFTDF